MKNIMAFGDSLTWGSCPRTDGRHPLANRWPDAMVEELNNVHLVSEGLRGRTTVFARPTASAEMSGALALPILLHSHAPLDLIMIMLGTNDIYEGFALNQIRDGLERLVEIVRHHPWRLPETCQPEIMLISPPPVTEGDNPDVTREKVVQSERLAEIIEPLATATDCAFFNAAEICRASPIDGFHLEAGDSRALGIALKSVVETMLQDRTIV